MSDHHHEVSTQQYGTSPKTLKAYVIGLVVCVILTLAAFAVVEKQLFTGTSIYVVLGLLAVIQLWVQVVCFLRLNANPDGRWNSMPFVFTILIMAILVGGTLWIMYNLNYNMM